MINFQFLKKAAKIFPFFLIFLGLILYLHNFLVYPPTRGLDSHDHIAFIKYIAKNWKIPKADEGLQMYQPPFYYILAAILYSLGRLFRFFNPLKFSQLISLFSALGNIILIYFLSKRLFKNYEVLIAVILFAIFLPMHIYESPVISNEMLLSFLSTLILYYFLTRNWEEKGIRDSLILGVICGFTCLTKYTGLILFLTFSITLFLKFIQKRNKEIFINFFIFLITVSFISGWFYLRQYLLFGNPLILANDPKLFPYWQEPGFRDLKFYTNLTGVFPLRVFGGTLESFWGGTYNTIWIDVHHTFLPVMEKSRAGALIIYLALIPSFIIFLGFFMVIKKILRDKLKSPLFLLIVFSLFSFISYFYYTYKLPFGSSIKAFYFLGNIALMAIYFGKGLELMIKWLKKYRWFLYLELLILATLIYKLYWYQSWWKNIGE